ncbi:Phosphoribosylaminoimidazole-succinocarboxamide synthase [Saitozyma sp. JCM 24511]|nr:Phosphoribosylaminoimidazole-succinocarboxamide synthase [Saitozyma sp. JCM 24511]
MADLEFANQAEASSAAVPHIALSPEAEAQFETITRNLQESTSTEIIRKVLSDGEVVRAYWAHIAYCVPLLKIADFLTAGVHLKILLADLHAFLDASKSTLETLQWRVKYYSHLLKAVFTVLGVPLDKLEFVTGTSYQLTPEYTMDMYRFHALTTTKAAEHAGADVVKESESPLMSSLLYPGLQALDEHYLDVHFQFGGADQRKIFMYAAHFLPRMGYAKRAHLMNPMVPGLSGGKMSSSDPKSKIDFLDSPAEVKAKLKAAVCTPGQVEGNGVLAFVKAVLIPVQQLREEQARGRGEVRAARGDGTGSFVRPDAPDGTIFSIGRPEKFGGDIHFSSYQQLEDAYAKEEIHPGDLKGGVTDALVLLLEPIRKMFDADPEWQEAESKGYPNQSVGAAHGAKPAGAKAEAKKGEPKVKAPKGSNKPPTEEERATLRLKKEQEKLAKAQAKLAADNLTPGEVQARSAEAATIVPKVPNGGPSSAAVAVVQTRMPKLKLVAKGKVRDIYELPGEPDKLLFVATDRISAFDVIMENGIPRKGITLTTLSSFWFWKLQHVIPNHVLVPSVPPSSPTLPAGLTDPASSWSEFPRSLDEYRDQLEGRSMIVRKCEVVKVEAIVRGYITGSAWAEYKKSKTVHGIPMPDGLVESQKLPNPIFTPSTKAEQGEHDENIHPDKVKDICGAEVAAEVERAAIRLYSEAAEYALARGLILADTKFEFGLLPTPNGGKQLILIDEVLTPDSSRYWSADVYKSGQPQPSFDKQYLRDWLISNNLRAKDGVTLPQDVVDETKRKYEEAKDRVIGLGEFGVHGKKGVQGGDEVVLQTDQVTDAIEHEAKKL